MGHIKLTILYLQFSIFSHNTLEKQENNTSQQTMLTEPRRANQLKERAVCSAWAGQLDASSLYLLHALQLAAGALDSKSKLAPLPQPFDLPAL